MKTRSPRVGDVIVIKSKPFNYEHMNLLRTGIITGFNKDKAVIKFPTLVKGKFKKRELTAEEFYILGQEWVLRQIDRRV